MIYPELLKNIQWKTKRDKNLQTVDVEKGLISLGDDRIDVLVALAKVASDATEHSKTDNYDENVLILSCKLFLEENCGFPLDAPDINISSLPLDIKIILGLAFISSRNKGLVFGEDLAKVNALYSCIYDLLAPSTNDFKIASSERCKAVAQILREMFPVDIFKRPVPVPSFEDTEKPPEQVDIDVSDLDKFSKTLEQANVNNSNCIKPSVKRNLIKGMPPPPNYKSRFGTMAVVEAPMASIPPKLLEAKKIAKSTTCQETGSIPTRFDRWAYQSIFKRMGKSSYGVGGTILIDWSGSMGLSPEDILKIIAAAPFCTVAVYCGTGSSFTSIGVNGVLTVIARNSRMANLANNHFGGANEVDGPAIEWLTRQRGPRIYVGDLHFTGVTDSAIPKDSYDYKNCMSMLEESDCIITPNIENTINILVGLASIPDSLTRTKELINSYFSSYSKASLV